MGDAFLSASPSLHRSGSLSGSVFGLFLLISGVHMALNIHALTFLSGMAAAVLSQRLRFVQLARSRWGNFFALMALLGVASARETAYAIVPILLLTLLFSLIANGTDLWGLLSARLARLFGEITYSMYLLHGPVLFVGFQFLVVFDQAAQLSPYQYWLVIAALVPVPLGFSVSSYLNIEKPAMRLRNLWVINFKNIYLK